MANITQINKKNFLPSKGKKPIRVYADKWNGLITDENTISIDTINEKTSGTGITLGDIAYSDDIRLATSVGTSGTGVTAVHQGSGRNIITVLTLSGQTLDPPTAAAAEAHGHLLYTFPTGAHFHEVTYMSIALQGGGVVNTDTPNIGIGSVVASGAVSVLGGTATFEDYITGQTASDCNGTVTGTVTVAMTAATAGYGTGISLNVAASTKTVCLNYADTWAGADTLTATGTVTIKWTIMS